MTMPDAIVLCTLILSPTVLILVLGMASIKAEKELKMRALELDAKSQQDGESDDDR